MTKKKQSTRGKPPRYEGEKSTRLSVLVRPRYRQALELIAKDRDSTLSEAMELAIAKLASSYIIEGRSALSYFASRHEMFESIISCIIRLPKSSTEKANENLEQLFKAEWRQFEIYLTEKLAQPSLLKSPYEEYCLSILKRTRHYIYMYFDLKKLKNDVFDEAWRTGLSPEEVENLIKLALKDQEVAQPFSSFIKELDE